MNANDVIKSILEQVETSYFIVGTTHSVKVTHINTPKDFYVRLASIDELVRYLEVRGEYITAQEMYVGKEVIYNSKTLEKLVRGTIVAVQNDICNIFAIDYGCSDNFVSIKNIYSTKLGMQCPGLAIPCQLLLCEPRGPTFDHRTIEAMHTFAGTDTAQITITSVSSDQKLTVDLVTQECTVGVGKLLAMLHYTAFVNSTNTINRLTGSPVVYQVKKYKYKKYHVGDRLCVRVQSGEKINNFYVAEVNGYKKFCSEKAVFNNYCKTLKEMDDKSAAEAAVERSCCGVKVRSDYERAIILKVISSTRALVKLVDSGKEIESSILLIKSVTSNCYNETPACAIYCSSTEEQVWKTSLPRFLYPGYEFIIEFVEIGNENDVPHKVNIFPMD